MDINGLEGDITHFDKIQAATRQMFELQMKEGHRYYRDGHTEEKRREGFYLSSEELTFECLGIALQNSVFLLCQCIGTQGRLVDSLSRNLAVDALGSNSDVMVKLVDTIQKINTTLRNFEIEKIKVKKE
ncbi:MAG: hypothetical protein J6N72_06895, partial [Psychrobacter sp.]|nr:hypothetical protein [Psychrobacter sp.]